MAGNSGQYPSSRNAREKSVILLVLGLALLLPPMAGIFQMDTKVFGVPVTLIYLFAVWAGLILGARLLSRHLTDQRAHGTEVGQVELRQSTTDPNT